MIGKRLRAGFTLIELLVVIGVIAVLLSLLLPALQRARAQANLIVCQSHLKSIGQLVYEYAAQTKGYLPYGAGPISNTLQHDGFNDGGYSWFWTDTLAIIATRNTADNWTTQPTLPTGGPNPYYGLPQTVVQNMAYDYPGIFHDVDTPPLNYGLRACDYTANPRVFPDVTAQDPYSHQNYSSNPSTPSSFYPIRQMGSLKRPSEVMMVWCGASDVSTGVENDGAYPLSWEIDNSACNVNAWQYDHGYLYPTPAENYSGAAALYLHPVSIANTNPALLGPCPSNLGGTWLFSWSNSSPILFNRYMVPQLKMENVDYSGGDVYFNNQTSSGQFVCEMRFRHLLNTRINALFVDGHVEDRLIGTVLAKDICLNPQVPLANAPPVLP